MSRSESSAIDILTSAPRTGNAMADLDGDNKSAPTLVNNVNMNNMTNCTTMIGCRVTISDSSGAHTNVFPAPPAVIIASVPPHVASPAAPQSRKYKSHPINELLQYALEREKTIIEDATNHQHAMKFARTKVALRRRLLNSAVKKRDALRTKHQENQALFKTIIHRVGQRARSQAFKFNLSLENVD